MVFGLDINHWWPQSSIILPNGKVKMHLQSKLWGIPLQTMKKKSLLSKLNVDYNMFSYDEKSLLDS